MRRPPRRRVGRPQRRGLVALAGGDARIGNGAGSPGRLGEGGHGEEERGSGEEMTHQWKKWPPFTSSAWPVIARDRSEAKKITASAISADVGMWFSAVRDAISA